MRDELRDSSRKEHHILKSLKEILTDPFQNEHRLSKILSRLNHGDETAMLLDACRIRNAYIRE